MKCCDAEMTDCTYPVDVTVGGHKFTRNVPGLHCARCGARRVPGPELVRLDAWVARELATGCAVTPTPEVTRFMRKAIGLSTAAMAGILDTPVDRVAAWEAGTGPIDQREFACLCSLVLGTAWDPRPDSSHSGGNVSIFRQTGDGYRPLYARSLVDDAARPRCWYFNPLVAVEGGDAAGKATLVAGLVDWLVSSSHIGASSLSFPDYSTPLGKLILANLRGEWAPSASVPASHAARAFGSGLATADATVRQSMMTVNRLESLPRLQAALRRGPVVLDRWVGSSLAYGAAEGLDQGWVDVISDRLIKPDLYLWLDVDPEVARARRPARDANESDVELQRRVRQRYAELAQRPGWVRLDASRPVADVLAAAVAALVAAFPHLQQS